MYIEQGYRAFHEGWRYLIGLIIVFFGWQFFGGIPLIVALLSKSESLASISADYGVMAETLGSNLFFLMIMLTFVAAMVSLLVVVRYLHRLPFKNFITSRKKVDWKRMAFAFLLWSTISVFFIFIDIFLFPENYHFEFKPIPFLILLILSVVFIPIQTSFEEMFARGYLMQGIGLVSKNKWLPLFISSTLFGFLHIFNPEVDKLGYGILVFYVGTGFFLGIATLMDEGLELPLGFHAANNLVAALLVTSDWMVFQTDAPFTDISEPVLGWDVLIPVFVIFPIILLIFAKKYRWKNWKEKLFGRVLTKEEFATLQHEDVHVA